MTHAITIGLTVYQYRNDPKQQHGLLEAIRGAVAQLFEKSDVSAVAGLD